MSMTAKERTLRALRFERPDRVPTFDNFWTEWSDVVRARYGIPDETSVEEYYQVDIQILRPDEGPYTTWARTVSETPTENAAALVEAFLAVGEEAPETPTAS